jgi:hypothetical protein
MRAPGQGSGIARVVGQRADGGHPRTGGGNSGPAGSKGEWTMERNAAWISLDGGRIEHVRVSTDAAGFSAKGLIVRREEHALSRFQYRIEGDTSWRLRRAIVHELENPDRRLELITEGRGGGGTGAARPSRTWQAASTWTLRPRHLPTRLRSAAPISPRARAARSAPPSQGSPMWMRPASRSGTQGYRIGPTPTCTVTRAWTVRSPWSCRWTRTDFCWSIRGFSSGCQTISGPEGPGVVSSIPEMVPRVDVR